MRIMLFDYERQKPNLLGGLVRCPSFLSDESVGVFLFILLFLFLHCMLFSLHLILAFDIFVGL